MSEEKISFEEAYKRLEAAAKRIMSEDVPLEEAVECYRDGLRYHGICRSILDNARQLIQIYDKESGELREMAENE